MLEGRDRIGGRAFTDTTTLGLPFDCGAHWLHSANQNPFVGIADRLGFAYNSNISFDGEHIVGHGKGGPLPAAVQAEAVAYTMQVLDAIYAAGGEGRDVPFSDFMDPASRWNLLLRQLIGQITSSDPEDCSTLDTSRYVYDGGDFPVEEGYGALVARNAAGLPVTLSTRHPHRLVRAPCTAGNTERNGDRGHDHPRRARQRADRRRHPLRPRPSGPLIEAFHDCPMGVSEKLAMLLDRPIEGLATSMAT